MSSLNNFQHSAADWRKQLRLNERRTTYVILMFIGLYVGVGLLIDMVLAPPIPLGDRLTALLTFQLIPHATLIMLVIAILSIWITYAMHDTIMMMGTEYHEILPDSSLSDERQLYNVIEEMKVAAGLRYMPKVYIIEADYMNAFASGYSEKSAMVAITRGLLVKLDRAELQAVMAHELSHIRHHDIKLTLTASVLSNLILIAIDLLFRGVIYTSNERDSKDRNQLVVIILILRFVLPIITVLLMLYLSRTREYMADAGSVELTRSNEPMARALLKITQDYQDNSEHYAAEYKNTPHEDVRRAAYIFDPAIFGLESIKSVASLFSTHPDIRDRLRALGFTPK